MTPLPKEGHRGGGGGSVVGLHLHVAADAEFKYTSIATTSGDKKQGGLAMRSPVSEEGAATPTVPTPADEADGGDDGNINNMANGGEAHDEREDDEREDDERGDEGSGDGDVDGGDSVDSGLPTTTVAPSTEIHTTRRPSVLPPVTLNDGGKVTDKSDDGAPGDSAALGLGIGIGGGLFILIVAIAGTFWCCRNKMRRRLGLGGGGGGKRSPLATISSSSLASPHTVPREGGKKMPSLLASFACPFLFWCTDHEMDVEGGRTNTNNNTHHSNGARLTIPTVPSAEPTSSNYFSGGFGSVGAFCSPSTSQLPPVRPHLFGLYRSVPGTEQQGNGCVGTTDMMRDSFDDAVVDDFSSAVVAATTIVDVSGTTDMSSPFLCSSRGDDVIELEEVDDTRAHSRGPLRGGHALPMSYSPPSLTPSSAPRSPHRGEGNFFLSPSPSAPPRSPIAPLTPTTPLPSAAPFASFIPLGA